MTGFLAKFLADIQAEFLVEFLARVLAEFLAEFLVNIVAKFLTEFLAEFSPSGTIVHPKNAFFHIICIAYFHLLQLLLNCYLVLEYNITYLS